MRRSDDGDLHRRSMQDVREVRTNSQNGSWIARIERTDITSFLDVLEQATEIVIHS